MQIPPSHRLSPFIRHYLFLEMDGSAQVEHRLIPDGHPGIVFHLGHPFLHAADTEAAFVPQPGSFIYGQVTRSEKMISTGPVSVFVVVLRPYMLRLILKLPAHVLANRLMPLDELWGSDAQELENAILYAASYQDRIERFESFFMSRISADTVLNKFVLTSLAHFERDPTSINIDELAESMGIGPRHLERVFSEYIGITPKAYANIIRSRYFLKILASGAAGSLTGMAYEAGFFDQAHSIRDFKNKSGVTPRKYLAADAFLALNFIQFDLG